jgi:hypothetical protein
MFLGLPGPDPIVRDMDPDPSIIKQKKSKKNIDFYCSVTSLLLFIRIHTKILWIRNTAFCGTSFDGSTIS